MAKRKNAKLIRSTGTFKLGYIDKKDKKLIEIWEHNGFFYKLTKKHKIECKFTEYKEFIPTISNWLSDINLIYRESKLSESLDSLIKYEVA